MDEKQKVIDRLRRNIDLNTYVGTTHLYIRNTDAKVLLAEHDRFKAEIEKTLGLIRENGIGKNSPDLEDAVRQVLQVALMERGNCAALKAENERLTVLRSGSEHDNTTAVVWWKRNESGYMYADCVSRRQPWWNSKWWTPLPTPRTKEEGKS